MASDYASCPICMEDYDFEKRIPKSPHCRHTLCKSCLLKDGRPLKKCPSCRKPIAKPKNVVNDLTMIDYMERKQQDRLRFLRKAISAVQILHKAPAVAYTMLPELNVSPTTDPLVLYMCLAGPAHKREV